jgi:hypothetical protein
MPASVCNLDLISTSVRSGWDATQVFTQAHKKTTGKFLKRPFALIVGGKQFTAQIIPKGFSHVFIRRRVSPETVYTI